MENTVVRVQDKGSRFALLTNEDNENKVEHQLARSSFKELLNDPSQEFERKVKLWIDKCSKIRLLALIGLNLLHQNTPNQVKCTVM